MKIINFILAIAFLVFAFAKINDPQPIAFILIYGALSVICILAMFKVYYRWLIIVVAMATFYYITTVHLSAREWVHSGAVVSHTEARDFFQLALGILVLILQMIRSFWNA